MKKFGNVLWGIVLIIIGLIIGGNALGITNINIFFLIRMCAISLSIDYSKFMLTSNIPFDVYF